MPFWRVPFWRVPFCRVPFFTGCLFAGVPFCSMAVEDTTLGKGSKQGNGAMGDGI